MVGLDCTVVVMSAIENKFPHWKNWGTQLKAAKFYKLLSLNIPIRVIISSQTLLSIALWKFSISLVHGIIKKSLVVCSKYFYCRVWWKCTSSLMKFLDSFFGNCYANKTNWIRNIYTNYIWNKHQGTALDIHTSREL